MRPDPTCPCSVCRGSFPHADGYKCAPVVDMASPQPDPCPTCNGDPVYHGLGCPVCCASPQPDTAPEGPVTGRGCVCWAANRTPPGDDTADHHHAGWCPVVDPQPDTAPEGPWTVDEDGRVVYPLADRDGVTSRAIYIGPGTFGVLWNGVTESESRRAHAALAAALNRPTEGNPDE